MPTHTKFKGVSQFGSIELTSQMEINLKTFLDWGMLEIGGFVNATIPTSGVYGGTFHTLKSISDPNFASGRVWMTPRKDWVWESGLEYFVQPIVISGLYVNSIFRPKDTTGSSGYVLDYPNGRVIFNSPLLLSDTVTMAHSYRRVQTAIADSKFFKQLQDESYRVDNSNLNLASGNWSQLPENRLQMPVIGIQIVPRQEIVGAQLGGGHYLSQNVHFYILAETKADRDTIQDILRKQKDKDIYFFDNNLLASGNRFPLTASGSIATNALCYPDLIKAPAQGGYQWKQCTVYSANLQDIGSISHKLYGSIVTWGLTLMMPNI